MAEEQNPTQEPQFGTEELQAWLMSQPREIAAAIAVRAALRIVPELLGNFHPDDLERAPASVNFTHMSFRMLTVARLAAADPLNNDVSSAVDGAIAVVDDKIRFPDSIAGSRILKEVANNQASIIEVLRAALQTAGYAPDATFYDPRFGPDHAFAISNDQAFVAQNEPAIRLLELPLWPNDYTTKSDTNWPNVRTRLLELGRNWQVWTDWYETIVRGSNLDLPPLRARAFLPKDLWGGPERVNTAILDLETEWNAGNRQGFQSAFTKLFEEYAPGETPPDLFIDEEEQKEDGDTGDDSAKPPPPTATQVDVISDRPETVRDLLNRATLAFAVATNLNRTWKPPPKKPRKDKPDEAQSGEAAFILHIDAPWGGGKTTFANFVARILNPSAFNLDPRGARNNGSDPLLRNLNLDNPKDWPDPFPSRKWITVTFNAWQNQHVTPPWWNFYETIRRRCFSTLTWRQWFVHTIRERAWRIWTPPTKWALFFIAVLFTFGVAALLGFNIFKWVKNQTPDWIATEKTVAALFSGGVLVFLFTAIHSGLSSFIRSVTESADASRFGEADPLRRFHNHFSSMIEKLDEPVLVVVDDLDRCKPAYVVDLMRGLLTIFNSPRVVYMLLGDKDWIEAAFAKVHEEMADSHRDERVSFGARFTEKVIQLSFILPEPDETSRKAFIRYQLNGPQDEDSEDGSDEAEPDEFAKWREIRKESTEKLQSADTAAEQNKVLSESLARIKSVQGIEDSTARAWQAELYRDAALRAVSSKRTEEEIRHGLEPVMDLFSENPRRIKRIINMIAIYQASAQAVQGVARGTREWKQMVLWVILMSEYPAAWRALCEDPEMLRMATAIDPENLQAQTDASSPFHDPTVKTLLRGAGFGDDAALDIDAVCRLIRLTPLM